VEFNVEKVSKIAWNDKVFKNLAMDHGRKVLVQSLIKSHADHPLDDFVTGKGLGLVINLFGSFAIVSFCVSIGLKSLPLHRPTWRGQITYGRGDKRTYVQISVS
jgi:hypothetical protein